MRTTIICILYSFIYFASQAAWAGDNVLQLSINGKNYEKLQLKIKMSSDNEFLQGSDLGNNLWEFHIPDSIYERGVRMALVVPSNDNVVHNLILSVSPQDSISIFDFYVKKKYSKLSLEYERSDTLKKVSYFRYKDVIFDHFYVSTDDFEFEANQRRLLAVRKTRGKLYSNKEKMDQYISLVKEYPDSHSLLVYLYSALREYDSKDHIKDILCHFSDQARKSHYGQLIQTYLSPNEFPNMQLQVLGQTSSIEPVIADREKDHLVIFTASWCAPCHKLIPVLKELYGELKDKMDFTYISIDDSRTIGNWPKVIQENEILWRCLIATDQLNEVIETYTIQGIPLAYHVTKDGRFKEINLQNAKERDKLIQELK